MYDETIVSAWTEGPGEVDWEPLEKLLPLPLCGPFMFMHVTVLENGIKLYAYKHSQTRMYLRADERADSWEFLGNGRYRRMRHSDAIEQVLDTSWVLDHSTEEEREVLRGALKAAWDRGNGDEMAGAHILPASPACGMRWLP